MKINDKVLKWIKRGVFIIYISTLVYFLFFAEKLGRTSITTTYRYNLTPFKEIKRFIVYYEQLGAYTVCVNLLGNIAAFIPVGIFIPVFSNNKLKIVSVTAFTFNLSLIVELMQLASKVGSFDVDDIILNTLGGIIGYLMFFVWKQQKKGNNSNHETI